MEARAHHELRTVRGAEAYPLAYRVWPAQGTPRATVVFLNGVMSHSGWFEPLAAELTAAGVHMVGADRRGTGTNTVARGDAPSAKHLVQDAAAIIQAEHAADRPLVVVGWCWGAVLAAHLAPELGSMLDGIVFVAPGLCPTALVSEKAEAEAARVGPGPEDVPVLPSPLSEDLFTAGPALEGFILRDELRLKAFTRRFRAIMDRMAMFAPRALTKLGAPVLLVLADADRATDNARTRQVFAPIPRLSEGTVPGQHGVQFDAPHEIVAHVLSFVGTLRR
jgi:alpha-beta hydrolase superfamily lysophospholipase